MNNQEFVNVVASKLNLSKKDSKELVDTVFDTVFESLVEHGVAPLGNNGKLVVKERAGRKGYNPKLLKELKEQGVPEEEAKQQAEIYIEAAKVPSYKPSKKIKAELN